MKKSNVLLAILAVISILAKPSLAQEKNDPWPELTAFHKVMSQTFHPSEEGNLQPIRERSGEMVEKATALAKSAIPAEFNKKSVQKAVKKLKADSRKLDKLVRSKAEDKVIAKALNGLHDTFHQIVELCSDEGEKK